MKTFKEQIDEIIWKLAVGISVGQIEPDEAKGYGDEILNLFKNNLPKEEKIENWEDYGTRQLKKGRNSMLSEIKSKLA